MSFNEFVTHSTKREKIVVTAGNRSGKMIFPVSGDIFKCRISVLSHVPDLFKYLFLHQRAVIPGRLLLEDYPNGSEASPNTG